MKGKPINELKDKSWQSIAPKSCSDYKDYFTLDNGDYFGMSIKRNGLLVF